MINLNDLGKDLNERSFSNLVDENIRKVIRNIEDQRTDWSAKRKIKIEITMIPDESRGMAEIEYTVQSVLAPVSGHDWFDLNEKRRLLQSDGYIKGQMDIRDISGEVKK